MKNMKNKKNIWLENPFVLLNKFELCLWIISLTVVSFSYILSSGTDILTLIASLIGVTALIFVSKGHVFGQLLTVVFSIFYGIISFKFHYYGEMITYLGMTAPIAAASTIAWIRHPYKASSEVEISRVSRKQAIMLILSAIAVTFAFYFILKYFGTENLLFSTLSVTTSFLAVSLTFLRNPAYALAYSANDIVLIILWLLATIESIAYLPMIFCFVMFLVNDMYGYFNWRRMQKAQNG